jgi:hypothetical protein
MFVLFRMHLSSCWIVLLFHCQYCSTYGHDLAIVMSRDELFSMADIVTPNVKEASKLLGDVSLHTISDMCNAAESIYKLGPKYVFSISVNLFYYLFSFPTCALSHSCASDVTSVWGNANLASQCSI